MESYASEMIAFVDAIANDTKLCRWIGNDGRAPVVMAEAGMRSIADEPPGQAVGDGGVMMTSQTILTHPSTFFTPWRDDEVSNCVNAVKPPPSLWGRGFGGGGKSRA